MLLVLIYNSSNAQKLKTKDGEILGSKEQLVSYCLDGALEGVNASQEFGGDFDFRGYCECAVDNLVPQLYSWEIVALAEGSIEELLMEEKIFNSLWSCMYGEETRYLVIRECVKGIYEEDLYGVMSEDIAWKYCECASDKMFAHTESLSSLLEMDDENSEAFNDIIVPCLNIIIDELGMDESSTLNSYIPNEISGGGNRSMIPLLDYFGQGYKIKISISGITKYYLFDTGASDMLIDRTTERELLLDGSIRREDYIGSDIYTLANNQEVEADLVRVHNIKIGDYTLENAVVAVIDGGSLLCGLSFLEKFRKWEVDKNNNTLILYK